MKTTYHTPVMLHEAMEGLNIQPGKRYIDATLGGGGHAKEIVKRGGIVLGLDADADAIAYATEELSSIQPGGRESRLWTCIHGNFRALKHIADERGFVAVSGVLMDLGVSSFQLDSAHKGFSYRFLDSQLDMRMDQSCGIHAAEYLNSAPEEELYEIFTKFGEEERSRAIAHALIRARQVKKFVRIGDLVSGIEREIGNTADKNSIFSRIFQSIRIHINDEIGALHEGLAGAYEVLEPGGRLVVISFHSIEDRVVKLFMKQPIWKNITKKPITVNVREQYENRRSRSSKLRVVEKI